MRGILGIGNALVDIMTIMEDDSIINKLGFPKGSMTLVDKEKSRAIKEATANLVSTMASGGSAANTIHTLGILGINTGFIGAIGKDETGRVFENNMKMAGVKTFLSMKEEDTGTALAMISKDSERTFATHLGAAETLASSDIDKGIFEGFDYLYIEGYLVTNMELVDYACKQAKKAGMKVALDLASFNVVEAFTGNFRHIIENYIDIVFANEDEARVYTGLEPGEAVRSLSESCEIAVVKTGKSGSLICRGEEYVKVSALEVESRDTTGAGDLYASGFLYGLLRGDSLKKCGAYGTVLAGNIIQVIGPKFHTNEWHKMKKEIQNIENH